MADETLDIRKQRRALYAPSMTEFAEVDVPPVACFAIDGHGDPNTEPAYRLAVEALYTCAYSLRAASKAEGAAFAVGPLEGLWTSDDPSSFTARDKGAWSWTMLIPIPEGVGLGLVPGAHAAAAARKPALPIEAVRLDELREGRCLQILHIGPYDDEGPTLARLHGEIMPSRRLTWNGPHHEIYLGDPRRAAPERLRTILRQPVRPVEQPALGG